MPAIINSAPDCIVQGDETATPEDDVADFVVGARYEDCAGFMTFGPGSTYGPDGVGAETAYMVLTWIGIVFMVLAVVAWILYENRRLLQYVAQRASGSLRRS